MLYVYLLVFPILNRNCIFTNINSISLQPQGVRDFRRILTQLLNDEPVGYGFVEDQWSVTLNVNGEPRRDGNGNILYHINQNSRDDLRRRRRNSGFTQIMYDKERSRRGVSSYEKDPYCVSTVKSILKAKRKAFTLFYF